MDGKRNVFAAASTGHIRSRETTSDTSPVRTRSTRRERARQQIVGLVLLLFWLLVFEGALRKWAFPQFANELYFVRDPFVVACYWIASGRGLFRLNYLFAGFALLSVLFVPVMAMQALAEQTNVAVLLYGWHNYFLYVPLAFLMGDVMQRRDIGRLMRHAMWMSLPISILVLVQFRSPPSSPINRNVLEGGFVFRLSEDIVRTTGTFSFTLGQSFFVGALVAIITAEWVTPQERRAAPRPLLVAATFCTMLMLVLSGSRSAFGFSIAVVCAAILSTLFGKHRKRLFRTLLVALLPVVIGAWLFVAVFPEAYRLMAERQQAAVASEGSTLGRGLRGFTDFVERIPDAPAIGYGLGYGTGAGSTLLTGQAQFTLAEDEWSRIILEAGPVFGVAYIALRVILALVLVRLTVTAARQSSEKHAFILLGFTLPLVLTAPITMQATANGFCWIFVGLTYAATRLRPDDIKRSHSYLALP